MGCVDLNVEDIAVMSNFYEHILGLTALVRTGSQVTFGKFNVPLIRLHHKKDVKKNDPHATGLYHFAILFSSRGDLARTIHHILKTTPHFFSGSGDHLVSEAFYFYDPEGNGIELYYDRDSMTWQWENGNIKMATLYIDPHDYIQRHIVLEEKNPIVQMGHVHLKVGDIEVAKKFYVDALGFEVTAQLPGALFISVGGYHHHIGLNTWESFGSGKRDESHGLASFECKLWENEEIEDLKIRLKKHAIPFSEEKGDVIFYDPWNTRIRVGLAT